MKKNIIFGLIIVSFVLAGCKQEAKDAKEASTEVLKELSGGQEAVTETPGQNMQSLKQRVIEDQTFEIQLDDWGMVTFTSVAPEDNSNKPEFLLMKNDKIMYEFPEITAEYVPVTDDEAVNAFEYLAKTEGIIPAIESAHAVAYAMKLAPTMDKDKIIVITISGRGDKDCAAIARYRGEDIHE